VKSFVRRGSIVVVGMAVAVLMSGCASSSKPDAQPGSGSSAGSTAKSSGVTITMYSGQHEQTTSQLVSVFENETGIKVKVRSDDEAVLANQIAQEGSRSPADVFYAENTPPLEFLREKNLLAPITPVTLSAVPGQYSSATGDWAGVSARVSVMVYNTKDLTPEQLPKSALDLASPAWKGKIGIAPGETDFQPIVTSMIKAYGKPAALKWLQGLKSNAGSDHSYPDNESLVDMVNKGKVEIGVINHYYWYRARDEVGAGSLQSAIAFFAPRDPGYILDVSGAGVLKSSKHQDAAQRLVAFLVSKSGEGVLAHSESYEYPLGSGVLTAKPLRPFDQLQPNALSIADLGDGQDAIALLQQAQLL